MPKRSSRELPVSAALEAFSQRPVAELLKVQPPALSQDEKDRHLIYCYLLLSLLAHYWARRSKGHADLSNAKASAASTYLGHNIGCLAVTERGEIVDFDFNHNEIFNSSIEHAEARLLRRLFALTHHFHSDVYFALPRLGGKGLIADGANWAAQSIENIERKLRIEESHYSHALSSITIYTSLESCAQCSGMMALGGVRQVVYLQRDPGQNCIGNILFNLNSGSAFHAPQPIPACELGLPEYDELESAYIRFCAKAFANTQSAVPAQSKRLPSITTFLASRAALAIFQRAQKKFKTGSYISNGSFKPRVRQFRGALSNMEVFAKALVFERLAVAQGRRGTPHSR